MPVNTPEQLAAIASMHFGAQLDRATQPAAALFTTLKVPLFNVLIGRVKVTSIIGEVTVQLGADATLAKLTGTPTVGNSVDLCANSASVANLAVGKRLVMTGTPATALTIADAGMSLWQDLAHVIGVGTIDITGSVQATAGSIKFTLHYFPIDAGAYVQNTFGPW